MSSLPLICSKIRATEFNKIVSFIAALQEKFDESSLLVSVSISISGQFDYSIFNLSRLSKIVEFISVVFDYKRTTADYRVNDAIKSLEISTDQERIEKILESGVPTSKLVMGIHFTGPAFIFTPNGKDEDAKFQKTFGYGAICKPQTEKPENWKKSYGPSGVSVVRKTVGLTRFVLAIENTRSIANKVRFAMKRGLDGIAPIFIDSDDSQGKCNTEIDTYDDFKPVKGVTLNIPQRTDSTFPLLRTIKETIEVTLDEMTQEAINRGLIPQTTPKITTSTTQSATTSTTTQSTTTSTTTPKTTTTSSTTPKTTTTTRRVTKAPTKVTTTTTTTTPRPAVTKTPKPVTPSDDRKVVCPIHTKTDLNLMRIAFDIDKVNWNWCTHVVTVSEVDKGMNE